MIHSIYWQRIEVALLLLLNLPSLLNCYADVLYEGCNVVDYYADLLTPGTTELRDDVTREELHILLESTHRNVLPYTNNDRDDVWKALMDLDHGMDENTVRLIYQQEDVPSLPHGTPESWNREHLWSKSRGVGHNGPDFTDVHHMKPSDWNINAARGNKFFGKCGVADNLSKCTIPAHGEASADTASDSTIFLPPQTVRGDIARAILYMDIRYTHLTVTDCPTGKTNEMAYMSSLLEWHILDPVSDAERRRNQQACERWQGNRNILVDYPELVERLFGAPKTQLGEGLGYPCSIPASQPPSPQPCTDLTAGDVMLCGFNSDNPDLVALVTMKDLQEGLLLYLTDNAWTGSSFQSNEGTISLQVPAPGISAGTVFAYGSSATNMLYHDAWEIVQGQFQLSADGDNIFLFCKDDEEGYINFLSGLEYPSSRSSLPKQLADRGAIVLPHFDNCMYRGATSGQVLQLQAWLSDPNQWEGSNEIHMLPPVPAHFLLLPPVSGEPKPGDVMVVACSSDNPDLIALVALVSLPGKMELYITDNAWTGSAFRTNEGTIKLTLPDTGIEAGTVFGYGANLLHGRDWEAAGGQFALSESGDAFFVYTKNEEDQIQHVSAFSYGGSWMDAGLAEDIYGSDRSALPASLLSVGAIILPHKDNYAYVGVRGGSKLDLQLELESEKNWRGSNTDPITVATTSFAVSSSSRIAVSSNSRKLSPWQPLVLPALAITLVRSFAD